MPVRHGPIRVIASAAATHGTGEVRLRLRKEALMEPGPFFDALAKVVPVFLLVVLGLLSIYTVVGVPFGIVFIGLAIALAVYNHRQSGHHRTL